jgi:hypothetical protein
LLVYAGPVRLRDTHHLACKLTDRPTDALHVAFIPKMQLREVRARRRTKERTRKRIKWYKRPITQEKEKEKWKLKKEG